MAYEKERRGMVDNQLIPRGINDTRVLDAFLKVPRHEFVPRELLREAYADYPLPIGSKQTISQPYIVALMTESMKLKGSERVLEIGTGSGYQAAILSELADEVYSIDRMKALADRAGQILDRLNYKKVKIKVGDGTLGWEEFAPFDGIVVTAGAPAAPGSLLKQLKNGGRLIIPIGGKIDQALTVFEKRDDKIYSKGLCGCMFVPLIGREGWQEG